MTITIDIATTIIGVSILFVITCLLLLSGSLKNIRIFTDSTAFHLKKWIFITFILLLNIAGCVMDYYLYDLHVVLYIILVFKSKDLIMSVMLPITILIRKMSFKKLSKELSFDDKVENIVAFIPTYNESPDQIVKTIDSIISNDIERHYVLSCIIADGTINDYTDIISNKMKEAKYNYQSWLGNFIDLTIIYGIRNDKHIMLLVKNENMGKKDSILLCNDIFNYSRSSMNDSMKEMRIKIRDDIENTFGITQFDYLFCTDGDTYVGPNAILSMVKSTVTRKANACCGVVNVDKSSNHIIWNNLQNFNYLYGQYVRRTFEDLFNQILCLPGCISMFKLDEESTNALDKFSNIPESSNVIDSCVQYIGTDRRYTSCLVYTNQNAKIIMDTNANAFTVPPSNFQSYISQRKRWCQNMFFNTILNIVGSNVSFISRLFGVIDVLRLSFIYFRMFNTIFFIYLLCSQYNHRDIMQYLPFIIILVYPSFCFFIYSLFNNYLRPQFFTLFFGFIINKIFILFSSSVIFSSMMFNIGNKSWK
jgi:chitin synthase